MSKAKTRGRSQAGRPWWRSRRIRLRSWALLLGVAITGVAVTILYLRSMESPGEAGTMGKQITPFQLPDVVSGQDVSMADYLGKQDVVIVGYMGWFCLGCEELLVELQKRQADFETRGVTLLVLGSKPESRELAEQKARSYGITYRILYDAETRITKDIGLWSNHMQMPWMGYLIIDKSARVVASDLQLAEAKGAAPRNVDAILAALDDATAGR